MIVDEFETDEHNGHRKKGICITGCHTFVSQCIKCQINQYIII